MTILYYRPDDPEVFQEYYMEKHLPLARQIPGLKKLEVGPVIRGPREPDYFWSAECYFDGLEDLKAGFASPAGLAAGKDAASITPPHRDCFVPCNDPTRRLRNDTPHASLQ